MDRPYKNGPGFRGLEQPLSVSGVQLSERLHIGSNFYLYKKVVFANI